MASNAVIYQYRGRLAAVTLALCTSVLAQSNVALGASPSGPISINDCQISNYRAFVSAHKPLAITFANRRAVAADEVRFIVKYGDKTAHISDVGTFSQNVAIHHAFNAFDGQLYHGFLPERCTVDYVHFTDGSVWTPQPSPAPTSTHD